MTTRAQLESSLSLQDPEALRLILDAAGVSTRGQSTASGLAARITDAIWWTYSTPLGYVSDRARFEDIVWHVARKLRVDDRVDRDGEAFEQVEQLTVALLGEVERHGVKVADLDPDSRRRLGASWLPTASLGSGAAGSFATRWASGRVVDLLKTPVGRLLPLLPAVGPYVGAIKSAASAVHTVAGPLGIGLSVLTFNQALGANYRKLVPLVLGVGALRPQSVDEAVEIEPETASDGEADGDDVQQTPPSSDAEAVEGEDQSEDDAPSEAEPEPADETIVADADDGVDSLHEVETVASATEE